MVTRPLVLVIICFGFFILLHSFVPKVMAQHKSNRINQLMSQDQRTRKRRNYILQLVRDSNVIRNKDNLGVYEKEPDLNPEELSTFITDYANIIRNDIVLLDDSVETKTRKKADIKMKRQDQTLPDQPCNCEYTSDNLDFGENSYPRFVETRKCKKDQNYCLPPYICKENMYEVTIIKRRPIRRELQKPGTLELPYDLRSKWTAELHPVSVGCMCVRDYIVEN